MQPKLFFVLGVPKSGTTWLQHLLNAHPNVSCRGEGRFHTFADALQRISALHNDAIAKTNDRLGFDFPALSKQEIKELFRYFIVLRMRSHPVPGKPDLQWIGEKDPEHTTRPKLMMSMFPTVPYIHIIRDPRDVAVSLRFHLRRRADLTVPEGIGDAPAFAKAWTDNLTNVRASAKQFGVPYHELRYEDLLDRPHETLATVFNFLGVDTAPVSACIEAASFEKLSGGRKPGQEDQASFFRKGIKGDWRNHMDAEQERAFVAATGGLMAELGYA